MRPFQWHLKIHWRFPMPLNSPIPWTQKMIQHGEWWLNPHNVLQGEFLHPREHNVLIFTDASNAGWGAHLKQDSTGGLWSQKEKGLHINLLELKEVILALKHFTPQCKERQVLIASDNSTVVAHINTQGGTHLVQLCALMWILLTWCQKHQVTLRARHIPGSLNVIADGLSRRNQIQHTAWFPVPPNIQTDRKTLGASSGGPIRNKTECQTSPICLSDTRRSGMGRGCPEHLMG